MHRKNIFPKINSKNYKFSGFFPARYPVPALPELEYKILFPVPLTTYYRILPNMASLSQNKLLRKMIIFLRFWIFFTWVYPVIFSMGFVFQIIFWLQITQILSYVLDINLQVEYKIQKIQNIKKFWKARWILLPSVYRSTLKNLLLTFCPNTFPDFPTCIVTPKTVVGQISNVKFFRVAPYMEVTSRMGFLKRAKKETFRYF